MDSPTETQLQVEYLEKLLTGYKARYALGEKEFEAKIRHTAAKLDELRLKLAYEQQPKKSPVPFLRLPSSGCCRGR